MTGSTQEYYGDGNGRWGDSLSNGKKGTSTIITRLERELAQSDVGRVFLEAFLSVKKTVADEVDALLSLRERIAELQGLVSEYTFGLLQNFLERRKHEIPKQKIKKSPRRDKGNEL